MGTPYTKSPTPILDTSTKCNFCYVRYWGGTTTTCAHSLCPTCHGDFCPICRNRLKLLVPERHTIDTAHKTADVEVVFTFCKLTFKIVAGHLISAVLRQSSRNARLVCTWLEFSFDIRVNRCATPVTIDLPPFTRRSGLRLQLQVVPPNPDAPLPLAETVERTLCNLRLLIDLTSKRTCLDAPELVCLDPLNPALPDFLALPSSHTRTWRMKGLPGFRQFYFFYTNAHYAICCIQCHRPTNDQALFAKRCLGGVDITLLQEAIRVVPTLQLCAPVVPTEIFSSHGGRPRLRGIEANPIAPKLFDLEFTEKISVQKLIDMVQKMCDGSAFLLCFDTNADMVHSATLWLESWNEKAMPKRGYQRFQSPFSEGDKKLKSKYTEKNFAWKYGPLQKPIDMYNCLHRNILRLEPIPKVTSTWGSEERGWVVAGSRRKSQSK